jgi:hypothetical protein
MHISRILTLLGFVLALAGCFLPWATIPYHGSISGSVGDGWFPVGFLVPAVVLAFIGTKSEALGIGKGIAVLILGVAAALFMVWKVTGFMNLQAKPGGEMISLGYGIWIEMVGGIAAFLGGLIGLKKKAPTPA